MKHILTLLLCNLVALGMHAQGIVGAWENTTTNNSGDQLRNVLIFTDGYYSATTFSESTGKFIKSSGGSWQLKDDTLTQHLEFDTDNPERVSTEISFKLNTDGTRMTLNDDLKLDRIDHGGPGVLQGAWLMSGRVIDGKSQIRDTSGPRKTMKILSGTRFQWIAYNTETKQFMGTGGGTYTTVDGVYTENIEFFSRDDSRVGNSLQFDYELIDGNWHHKGLSSKGDPINEIWNLRT
ncbi:membrane or secreted protein [Gelidibacter salicanalis]|uniref:Membrane or secreted protein n=1 Tax=Gelidibacter salicanalis TaxID=291193 RepID=A0A934NDI5_9FLAO|nr:membrane or secreted protein [Gelidibacter salicanalis]MBJ7881745.1 membrane or secreted protein [Gelidibacter salicanalis]